MTTICESDPTTTATMLGAIGEAATVASLDEMRLHLESSLGEDTVVVGPGIDLAAALRLADGLRVTRPSLGVVLVRRRIDASLLAEALRAGVREVVDERDLQGLNTAVRRSRSISSQLRAKDLATEPAGRQQGRVITVFATKGGCGKTTLATNLAAALADRGRRAVCLVDLDLSFGDVAIALQLFPAHTIADAVSLGDGVDFSALQALLTPHSPGLTTLVAPVEPGAISQLSPNFVSRLLQVLREHFDMVVVDTPAAFDEQVLAAFDAADHLVLLATLDIPALKNLKITLETLDLLDYDRARVKVVINRADSKVGLSLTEVERTLRTSIALQVPSSRDVPAAVNRGVPIVLDDPRHPVSIAIKDFAEHQLSVGGPAPVPPPTARTDRRRGLFSRRRTP